MLLIYTSFVYAWGLGTHPMGRDYAVLAGAGEGLPALSAALLRFELAAFGAHVLPYQLLNLALLYASVVFVYQLTLRVVTQPPWLGNFAAVLFMANPVHTEAVLNMTGSTDLLPCVAGLGALAAYAAWTETRTFLALAAAGSATAFALHFPTNLPLLLVMALYEGLVRDPDSRRFRNLALPAVLTVAALALHAPSLDWTPDPVRMWAPLYFILYPLGFLPESAHRFHAHPSAGWAAALVVATVILLILRKAGRTSIVFGLLGAFAARLVIPDRPVDPVHLVGGGQLLLANALVTVSVAALFLRMMDHPRWRMPLAASTTVIGAIFFALQIHANLVWKEAGREVRAFQAKAAAQAGTVGVLPDIQYSATAPMMLSQSIAYDTPFSRALPHRSLLPIHRLPDEAADIEIRAWTPDEGLLAIRSEYLRRAAPWPYGLATSGKLRTPDVLIETSSDSEPGKALLRIVPRHDALPNFTLPLHPVEPQDLQ